MSDKTEKRIVELEFNNDQFKKGVADTLENMKKLDNAFDMKGSVENIKHVDTALQNVDTSKLSGGVEKVKMEFDALGMVAFSAINKITGSIMDMGASLVNDVAIKPITDGLDEYTLKMNSIKTIQTNTMGKNSLEDINRELAELNEYADKTIYNFGQMTHYIGTFTSSGVDLEQATDAIQGIANYAAAAGANANQASSAMYNFSQSLAAGRLQLIDWRSIENSTVGSSLMKNALLRTSQKMFEMGEVDISGLDAIADEGSFNDSLKKGWATSEVMLRTLEQITMATEGATEEQIEQNRQKLIGLGYSEDEIQEIFAEANAAQIAATKVKTFQQLVETTQEALGSGWAVTWEYIIGNIEEAENFYTMISDSLNGIINSMADARNAMFKEWHDTGGRDALIMALVEFANVIQDLAEPIANAFNKVFKPLTGKQLTEATIGLRDFVTGIRDFLENTAEGQAILKGLEDVFTIVFTTIKTIGGVAFNVLKTVLGVIGSLFSTIMTVGGRVMEFLNTLGVTKYLLELLDVFSHMSDALFDVVNFVLKNVSGALMGVIDLLTPIASFIGDNIVTPIRKFLETLGGFDGIKLTVLNAIGSVFENLANAAGKLVEFFKPVGEFFTKTLSDIGKSISDFVGSLDVFGAISNVGNTVSGAFSGLFPEKAFAFEGIDIDTSGIEGAGTVFDNIYAAASSARDVVIDGLGKGITFIADRANDAWKVVGPFFENIKNTVIGVWNAIQNAFRESGISFDSFKELFTNLVASFARFFEDGMPTFEDFLTLLGDLRSNFETFINDVGPKFSNFIQTMGDDIRQQLNGPFAALWDFLSGLSSFDPATLISGIPKAVGGVASGIFSMVKNPLDALVPKAYADDGSETNVDNGREGIVELANQQFDMVASLKSIATTLSNPLKLVKDFFTNVVPTALKSIAEAISSTIKNMPMADIRGFVADISSIGLSAATVYGAFEIDNLISGLAGASKKLEALANTFNDLMKSAGKALDSVSGAIAKDISANAFLKRIGGIVAITIALTACIWAVSKIPDPWTAVGVIGALLVLGGVFSVLVSMFVKGDSFRELGTVALIFVSMALLFKEIGKAITTIASMPNPEAAKPVLIGVAGFLILFGLVVAGIAHLSGKGLEAAGIILAMAVALGVLTKILMVLAAIPYDVFINGFERLVLLLAAIVVPLLALGLIGPAVEKAGLAMVALAGSLLILGVALNLVQNTTFDPGMLVALGLGLVVLSGVLWLMKSMKLPEEMMKSAAALLILSAAVVTLGIALVTMSMAFGGDVLALCGMLVILAGALLVFGMALRVAGGLESIKSATGILIVCVALGVLAGIVLVLSSLPWEQLLKAALIMGVAIAAIAALSLLVSALEGPLTAMNITLLMLGQALMLIAGAFALFTATLIGAGIAAPYAVQGIIDAFNLFQNEMAGREEEFIAFAYTIGRSLAAVLLGFLSEIGNAINNWLANFHPDLPAFLGNVASSIITIIPNILGFILDGVKGFAGMVVDGISGFFCNSIEEGVSNANPDLQQATQNYDWAKPAQAAGEEYTEQTAQAIEDNGDVVQDATVSVYEDAGAAGGEAGGEAVEENFDPDEKAIAGNVDFNLLASLYGDGTAQAFENGEVGDMFAGIGSDMGGFMTDGMLQGLSSGNLDPTQMFNSMGLGDGALDQQSMDVGKGVGQAVSNGAAISLADNSPVDAGVNAQLGAISAREGDYRNTGSAAGGAYSSGIVDAISGADIDPAVNANMDNLSKGIDSAHEVGIQTGKAHGTGQIEAIEAREQEVSETITNQMYAASNDSDSAGAGVNTANLFVNGLKESIEANTASGLVSGSISKNFDNAVSYTNPAFKGKNAGVSFVEGVGDGVSSGSYKVSSAANKAFTDAESGSGAKDKGKSAGTDFGSGMEAGINEYASKVAEAAADMVRKAKEAADKESNSNSPSKEMIKRGHWFDEGMVIGINEYSSRVSDAAGSMVGDALGTMSSSFSLMGALVDDIDWDADPVITPVLDLDQFIDDASTMSSFMPDSQVISAGYAGYSEKFGTSVLSDAYGSQNQTTVYVTLDWKAGTSANQVVKQLADELQTFSLTKGR